MTSKNKYNVGDTVVLLDVPKIRTFQIEDVICDIGRNIYKLAFEDFDGIRRRWWVEENRIAPQYDSSNELDEFLDEW